MNLLNAIPIIGWLLAGGFCLLVAIPIHLLWNWLAPIYFYWLPSIYQNVPYLHTAGLIWLIGSLKGIFLPNASLSSLSNLNKKD